MSKHMSSPYLDELRIVAHYVQTSSEEQGLRAINTFVKNVMLHARAKVLPSTTLSPSYPLPDGTPSMALSKDYFVLRKVYKSFAARATMTKPKRKTKRAVKTKRNKADNVV